MKIGLEISAELSREGDTQLGAVLGATRRNIIGGGRTIAGNGCDRTPADAAVRHGGDGKELRPEAETMAADTNGAGGVDRRGGQTIGEAALHVLYSLDPRGPKSGCSSRDKSGRHVEHEARAKMTGSGGRPLKLAMLSDVANQRDQQERPVREHAGVKDAPHHAAAALAGLVGRAEALSHTSVGTLPPVASSIL